MPKARKDPNAPKRPLSAYLFYSNVRRPQLKDENPEMKFGEYGKIIGKEWKDMDDGARQPYLDKAEADKKRYEREMNEYNA